MLRLVITSEISTYLGNPYNEVGFVFERPIRVWGYEFIKETVELRFFHLIRKKVLLNEIWICAKFSGWKSLFSFLGSSFLRNIYE